MDACPVTHPYHSLPAQAFWKSAVAGRAHTGFPGVYVPKFEITHSTRIATAGSCFAQHVGRALLAAGCTLLDAEQAPVIMPDTVAHRFGYRLFSARYGNIYTARQLHELLTEIAGDGPDPHLIWENDGRFRDALRPTVEPQGLATADEVLLHRDYHLERTSRMLTQAQVFVFTLGLTEGWVDTVTNRILPVCPGVNGGHFDANRYRLHIARHREVLDNLARVRALLHRFNPTMQMLLTVSPVPLTATATGQHVLEASAQAKATLRSAAAEFASDHADTAYFPSFELITHPASGGPWFAPNMRSVLPDGVARVMEVFFAAHGITHTKQAAQPPISDEDQDDEDICEDRLLEAFAK